MGNTIPDKSTDTKEVQHQEADDTSTDRVDQYLDALFEIVKELELELSNDRDVAIKQKAVHQLLVDGLKAKLRCAETAGAEADQKLGETTKILGGATEKLQTATRIMEYWKEECRVGSAKLECHEKLVQAIQSVLRQ